MPRANAEKRSAKGGGKGKRARGSRTDDGRGQPQGQKREQAGPGPRRGDAPRAPRASGGSTSPCTENPSGIRCPRVKGTRTDDDDRRLETRGKRAVGPPPMAVVQSRAFWSLSLSKTQARLRARQAPRAPHAPRAASQARWPPQRCSSCPPHPPSYSAPAASRSVGASSLTTQRCGISKSVAVESCPAG